MLWCFDIWYRTAALGYIIFWTTHFYAKINGQCLLNFIHSLAFQCDWPKSSIFLILLYLNIYLIVVTLPIRVKMLLMKTLLLIKISTDKCQPSSHLDRKWMASKKHLQSLAWYFIWIMNFAQFKCSVDYSLASTQRRINFILQHPHPSSV